MAYTQSMLVNGVMGSQRAIQFKVTADANSGLIDPGLSSIDSIAFAPISMASASEPKLKANLNAASATAAGKCLASGFANGDTFYATFYGR